MKSQLASGLCYTVFSSTLYLSDFVDREQGKYVGWGGVYLCVDVYTCFCLSVCVCVYVSMRVCVYICLCVCVCVCLYAYLCVCLCTYFRILSWVPFTPRGWAVGNLKFWSSRKGLERWLCRGLMLLSHPKETATRKDCPSIIHQN